VRYVEFRVILTEMAPYGRIFIVVVCSANFRHNIVINIYLRNEVPQSKCCFSYIRLVFDIILKQSGIKQDGQMELTHKLYGSVVFPPLCTTIAFHIF